jgi:hypothetical protein
LGYLACYERESHEARDYFRRALEHESNSLPFVLTVEAGIVSRPRAARA